MDTAGPVDLLSEQDLYLQVKDSIQAYVRAHRLRPDDQLPTNRQFSALFKVSALTVQRAVGALAAERLVYTRRGRGTFVRQVGERRMPRPRLYGCVVPTIQNNTVAAHVSAIDDLVFDDSGNHLIVANTRCSTEREVRLLDSLLARGIDALIYQPNPTFGRDAAFVRAVDERLQAFLAASAPVVMLDAFPVASRYDTVMPDDVRSCELAVRHLFDLGHRDLVFYGNSEFFGVKITTFQRVGRELGLGADELHVVTHDADDFQDAPPANLADLLEAECPFTGVVAATDDFALSCIRFLRARGICCPADVSVVGADNVAAIRDLDVPLTTVWCEPAEMARAVCQLVEGRVAQGGDQRAVDPQVVLMAPRLEQRGSTAPAPVPV